jgi:hypothetical protein
MENKTGVVIYYIYWILGTGRKAPQFTGSPHSRVTTYPDSSESDVRVESEHACMPRVR